MPKKRFKPEFVNCRVTVRSLALGKIEIDTRTADPDEWAAVKEFAHLFEDDVPREIPIEKTKKKKTEKPAVPQDNVSNTDEPPTKAEEEEKATPTLEELSLKQLREKFPDVKAASKVKFIEKLQELGMA